MLCPVCSNELPPQAAFCNRCGAAVSAAAPPPPSSVPPPPVYSAPPPGYTPPPPGYAPPAAAPGLSDTAAATLAYITIIPPIIFLIIEPYNRIPLVRFHSVQCLGLALISFALHLIVNVLGIFLHVIPVLGLIMTGILHGIVFLGILIVWLVCIVKASKGEWYKLPVIGDFAEKQARV